MAQNKIITSQVITREGLAILQQESVFLPCINTKFKADFAKSGHKIGDTLNIRLPNQFIIRKGMSVNKQGIEEDSIPLKIDEVYGVDFSFVDDELTLKVDDFRERYLVPSMSRLAGEVDEAVYRRLTAAVPNIVDRDGQKVALNDFFLARKVLNTSLTPDDGNRTAILSPEHAAILGSSLTPLYNDQKSISNVFRKGLLGQTVGFNVRESTFAGIDHQTGSAAKTTGYAVVGANQKGSKLTVGTGETTFKTGDIISIAGVFDVHPQTKRITANLKTFVITADYAGGAGNLDIYPAITPVEIDLGTGLNKIAKATVSNSPAAGAAIVKLAAGANETYNGSILFHKNAFTFASVPMSNPKDSEDAYTATYNGVTLNYVRYFNGDEREFTSRFDILFGCAPLRPEWACRLHADNYA